MAALVDERKALRVLCFHSFRTNAKIFNLQLELCGWKDRFPWIDFVLLDAPYECTEEDEQKMRLPKNAGSGGQIMEFFPKEEYGAYREWYNANDAGVYDRLDATLAYASKTFEGGGFDGLLGFSQGGNLATMIAVLAERGALPAFANLGFVVGLSSHRPRDPSVAKHLDAGEPLKTPSLFVVHADDPVVPAALARSLVASFAAATVVEIPGAKHAPATLTKTNHPEIGAFFDAARARKEAAAGAAYAVRGRLGALVRERRDMGSPRVGDLLPTGARVVVVEERTIPGGVVRCRIAAPVAGWVSRKNLERAPA